MLLPGLLSDPHPPPLLCLVLCPQVPALCLSVRVLVLLLETLCCVHRRGFHLLGLLDSSVEEMEVAGNSEIPQPHGLSHPVSKSGCS